MQTLNNAELAFLSILAYPELTKKALKLCAAHTMLFTHVFCPHLFVMWSGYLAALKKHKKQNEPAPSREIIAADLAEVVQGDRDMPQDMAQKCDDILQRLIRNDVPTLKDGIALVQKLVQLDVNRKISAKVTMNADLVELQKTLDASKRVLDDVQESAVGGKIMFNPFREIDTLAVHTDRIPTGINWLDEITSGGGRAGELWLVLGPSGGGKCLGKDTPVLMYDGSIKMSQDIAVGDVLMGPDSMPRNVLQLGRGRSKMYKIIPCLGMPYVVNSAHILTLECGSTYGVSVNGKHVCTGERVNPSVSLGRHPCSVSCIE